MPDVAPIFLLYCRLEQHKIMIFSTFISIVKRHGGPLGLLLILSLLYQIAIYNGQNPYVFLGEDAANIAAFTAARENPEFFRQDALLAHPENFRFYQTVHLYFLPWLKSILGDYGTAFISTLGATVFLQLLGFYLLGWLLLRDRLLAVLLAIVSLSHVRLNMLSDYWGFFADPLPRSSFQAFLPFLLSAAYYWRQQPRFWPGVMALAGLGMYIHPVSAPIWGVAIWLGFLVYLPASWSWVKKILVLVGVGMIYVISIAPFAFNYFIYHSPSLTLAYQQVWEIVASCFCPSYLDIFSTLIKFFTDPLLVWLFFCLLVSTLYLSRRYPEKRLPGLLSAWLGGILLTAVIIPIADQTVSRVLQRIPFELDLIRGLRFIIPLSLIATFLALATWRPYARGFGGRWPFLVFALILLIGTQKGTISPLFRNWKQAGFWQTSPMQGDLQEALEFLRCQSTARGSVLSLLPRHQTLAIRYYSLKSLAFSFKDGPTFAYANHTSLLAWQENALKLRQFLTAPLAAKQITELMYFAQHLGAAWVVLPQTSIPVDYQPPTGSFRNAHFAVLAVF
jgi:hypothetical protein